MPMTDSPPYQLGGRREFDGRKSHRRSRSPSRRHQGLSDRKRSPPDIDLPFRAQPLSKHDLRRYRSMFATYLDIQKELEIDELSEDEIRGRWKSFVGKWNRGELSRGWYDPRTLEKASGATTSVSATTSRGIGVDNDTDYGPAPPEHEEGQTTVDGGKHYKTGPSIPSLHDLQARREDAREEETELHKERQKEFHHERRLDRQQQKERLDELVPRAEAGTRERQLEKKREKADSNRAFASTKEAGGDIEVRDSDLMGDEDSLSELKRMKKEQERKKTEREIRREEIMRVRTAEREERMAGRREKEAKTMDMFKEIARARFGGGGSD